MSESLLTKLTKTVQTDTHALTELFRGKPKQVLELARERKSFQLSLFVGAIIATNVFANYEYGDGAAMAREAPGATHKVELVNEHNQEAIKGFGNIHIPLSVIEKHKDRFNVCVFGTEKLHEPVGMIGFDGCIFVDGTTPTSFDGMGLDQKTMDYLEQQGVKKIYFEKFAGNLSQDSLIRFTQSLIKEKPNLNFIGSKTHNIDLGNLEGNSNKLFVTDKSDVKVGEISGENRIVNLSAPISIQELGTGAEIINGGVINIDKITGGKIETRYSPENSKDKALTFNSQSGGWIIYRMVGEPITDGINAFLNSKQAELTKLIESEKKC